jgi:hypothetical protein
VRAETGGAVGGRDDVVADGGHVDAGQMIERWS